MPFSVKDWQDKPSTLTPITAAALEDMETRLSNYSDSVSSTPGPTGATGATGPTGPPGVGASWKGVWSGATTYALGDGVYRTGVPYVSNLGSNLNHDPATDTGTNWSPITLATVPPLYVDTLSGAPRSVSDWGALLNTAISGGARCLIFGPYDYTFSTVIAANDIRGVQFMGTSAYMGGPAANRTRLIFSGTGSGAAVNCTNSTPGYGGGFYSEHIAWLYSSASYTGSYFDFNNAFMAKFNHCYFSNVGDTTPTERAAINARNMNTLVCDWCNCNAYNYMVEGRPSGSTFSNVVRLHECTIGPYAAVVNPGLDYVLDHCVLEPVSLAANGSVILDDRAYGTGDLFAMVTLRDCEYWDVNANANHATLRIVKAANNYWNFAAYNCYDHDSGKSMAKLYDLPFGGTGGSATVVIEGGSTNNDIDVGNASTAYKTLVRVVGVNFAANSNLSNHNTGHDKVTVEGNRGLLAANGYIGSYAEVGHQLQERFATPTFAAHAGTTNITVGGDGYDACGYVTITNTAGGTSATGLLADVTFAAPPTLKTGLGQKFLVVELTPISILGVISGGGPVAANCQAYAYVDASAFAVFAKFFVGIQVGIPAGQGAAWSYFCRWI